MKNFFDQIPFFVISKMAKNQFMNWEKLPKMQFRENIFFDLFDLTSFFAWTFLNFQKLHFFQNLEHGVNTKRMISKQNSP